MSLKRETAPRFSGIGGHHSHRAGTVEWLTPPSIIAALGPFDLDPCASVGQPVPTARRMLTRLDNGLTARWGSEERVWLNPPYSHGVVERWLARLAEHGRGTALIFARMDTDAFHEQVFNRASALLFMRGRVTFVVGEAFDHPGTGRRHEVGDQAPGNAGAPTVLCAYGLDDADVLAACGIEGRFVPLRIPRSVLVAAFSSPAEPEVGTWREEIAAHFASRPGPVTLDDLYRAFSTHPKARGNLNFAAKIRQQLQLGPYRRVAPALWDAEPCPTSPT